MATTKREQPTQKELEEGIKKLKEIAGRDGINEQTSAVYAALYEFFSSIVKELGKDPELANMSLDEAIESGKLDSLLQLAAKSMGAENVETREVKSLSYMLDKLDSIIWSKKGNDIQGVDVANEQDKKQGVKLPVMYSIDFSALDELEDISITRSLEPYDKRVYIAVAAYYAEGMSRVTYQQIYKAMGYKGRAGKSDLDKIHESITKMSAARISVDNKAESSRYNKVKFTYDGALLPMERITGRVNGQIADSIVHMFREPPLMTFARERKQLTTVSVRLLNSPLSKTSANMELEDYLIVRISHMRNGFPNHKMAFETIYEKAGITTKKQRQRALSKITKLLDYYKEVKFIRGYKIDDSGVLIEL